MENNLQVFSNTDFGEIRTADLNGKVYFVATDVAKALGYSNTNDAITRHCRWVVKHDIPHPQSKTKVLQVNAIPEGDIYRLISNSELEKAQEFEAWIFDEVLPTIRKTGGYVGNEDLFVETYLPYIDDATKEMFKNTLLVVRKQNEIIENQKKEIIHKEDVIIGLVDNISLAEKRQILNRVVKKTTNGNYAERYNELYKQFELKYHCDLKRRLETEASNYKPKIKNKMDYIDRVMRKIPELYEIAAKLYENDVKILVDEIYALNNTK